nr:hypothetical protein [Mycoplasmopsis bovis]
MKKMNLIAMAGGLSFLAASPLLAISMWQYFTLSKYSYWWEKRRYC